MPPARSLQLHEARDRAARMSVTAYDVRLDLAADEDTFGSLTTVTFTSTGGETFCDLRPVRVGSIRLNGSPVDPDTLVDGRLPLATDPGENELVVDAVMGFRSDGEGLHRSVDPADGRHYVYAMSFMDAAPSIFACFDQPDLKATYTLEVVTPPEWTVIGNAPAREADPGRWEVGPTQPLPTYLVTLVAGPWHVLRDEHDGIPLGLSARRSLARELDEQAGDLWDVTRACFDEYHRLFGIRYPFGDYHQAFVPEVNAGAMENPGCVTFRDQLLFSSRVPHGRWVDRATTVAHELAHQWFGNITSPRWWDDLWLNESFAEYLGTRVTSDVTRYDAWTHHAWSRTQWGLVADQRPTTHPVAGNPAPDARTALQDFDGISYVKGASVLRQLDTLLGDEVFLSGVIDHLTRARFGNATLADLLACWERAGGGDLSTFSADWLESSGVDTLRLDRAEGAVRREPPAAPGGRHPGAARRHAIGWAAATDGRWRTGGLEVAGTSTPLPTAGDEAVLLDPWHETWALVLPDQGTVAALPGVLPDQEDPALRAGAWNIVRNGFHNAEVAPQQVLDLVEAVVPGEQVAEALATVLPWVVGTVVPLSPDPHVALERVWTACTDRLADAQPGGDVQLATLHGLVSVAEDPGPLRAWLSGAGLPRGIDLDLDLRWRILVRLAALGATDPEELRVHLELDRTALAEIEHTRAAAALPTAEAKATAWEHLTGARPATNQVIAAAGEGMWRPGQEHLTAPYVARYFEDLPGTADVHAGWMLGTVASAYFPLTVLEHDTLERARSLAAEPGLDAVLRRRVLDQADELARRLAVRDRFAGVAR